MNPPIQLLDVVALNVDLLERGLSRGQVGTKERGKPIPKPKYRPVIYQLAR
jgi:hypothetical protein